MTKFNDIKFTTADVIKLIGFVIITSGWYYGISQKQDELSAKMDKVIVIQEAVDKMQDFKFEQLKGELADMRVEVKSMRQPAMRPKPINIETEEQ